MEKQQPRFLAVVQDLLFVAKIAAAAKRVGVLVEFVPEESRLLEKAKYSPSVVILDLNHPGFPPIPLIRKLKANAAEQAVQVIGFLSHVQQDLNREAHKAGCDLVLPRSVFSKNLDELLRQRSCHLPSSDSPGCLPDTVHNGRDQ